jgi:hypothetical protein
MMARRRRSSLAASQALERYAYHGTSKTNLRAIRAVGLVPKFGDNSASSEGTKDGEAQVCLALDKKTAKEYAGDQGVVLKVDLASPHAPHVVPDPFEGNSVKTNQRIPPQAVKVADSAALRAFRLADAYARDPRPRAQFTEAGWMPDPETLATQKGFIEDRRDTHGNLGTSIAYHHQNGDRLILTRRENFETPVTQHAGYQDRLQGASSNWSTRWEMHTQDGVKSTGYDSWGLQDHLARRFK